MARTPLEECRLEFLLRETLSRESRNWKSIRYPPSQSAAVCPVLRDQAIGWLSSLADEFSLCAETLAQAIHAMDRFLSLVKAHPRYLRCIAITCLFIATKTFEEDEVIPGLRELVSSSDCGFSHGDVVRMERLVLAKLGWNLFYTTPLAFLYLLHALAMGRHMGLRKRLEPLQGGVARHAAGLAAAGCAALQRHQLAAFPSSHLALALLSLELEYLLPDWLSVTISLQGLLGVSSQQLVHCREAISLHLVPTGSTWAASHLVPNTLYIYRPPLCALQPSAYTPPIGDKNRAKITEAEAAAGRVCGRTIGKRKVQPGDVEDFYDGIKRLYNEEPADGGGSEPCGSPCPLLQPPSPVEC